MSVEEQKNILNAFIEVYNPFGFRDVILRSNYYNCVNTEQFTKVIEEIGRALHYLQDVSCPHHSSNKTAATSNHALFEKYVDEQIETILNENRTVTCQYRYYAENNNVEAIMYHAAKNSAIKYIYTMKITMSQVIAYGMQLIFLNVCYISSFTILQIIISQIIHNLGGASI